MINAICGNPDLFNILRGTCEEEGVKVAVCPELLIDGEADDSQILILKIDRYYNTQNFAKPPKSIDCLIVIDNKGNRFSLDLLELKSTKYLKRIKFRDIHTKFKTTIENFMKIDFKTIFLSEKYKVIDIELHLVAGHNFSQEQFRRKIKAPLLDAAQSFKPFEFRGHIKQIELLSKDRYKHRNLLLEK
ncbi:MAG: hypothetical protein EOM23_03835 [Candidatus Moranbacteria bacterium]|nr:hypothetical protein [Candidatus Moranbacteria bacterium]